MLDPQYGKHFVVSTAHSLTCLNLDVVGIFESIFDTDLMQVIVSESNKYAEQKI
jgi:hypothetical protein